MHLQQTTGGMFRRPTGWLPLALPVGLLTFMIIYLATMGVGDNRDEGTAAHIFQLVMALELVLLVVFAARWIPRAPRPAAVVLGVQAFTASLPIALVLTLGL